MEFEKIDIHELLPQQEPFVMVGKLCHFDMEKTITGWSVHSFRYYRKYRSDMCGTHRVCQ